MPELKLRRSHPEPVRMICMYCGAPATNKQEWRVVNEKNGRGGGGTDITPVPPADDPLSALIGLILLPLLLWDLIKSLGAAWSLLTSPKAPPPKEPTGEAPTTLVTVTTCDRHRRFRDRFLWVGLALFALLVVLWIVTIRVVRRDMGTEDIDLAVGLLLAALGCSVALPVGLSVWYFFAGPVIVDRVNEEEVVLDRVRMAYFEAIGIRPEE